MTKEQRAEFFANVLQSDDFKVAFEAGLGKLAGLMSEMQNASKARDETEACKAIARMSAIVPEILKNATEQYGLMETKLDQLKKEPTDPPQPVVAATFRS